MELGTASVRLEASLSEFLDITLEQVTNRLYDAFSGASKPKEITCSPFSDRNRLERAVRGDLRSLSGPDFVYFCGKALTTALSGLSEFYYFVPRMIEFACEDGGADLQDVIRKLHYGGFHFWSLAKKQAIRDFLFYQANSSFSANQEHYYFSHAFEDVLSLFDDIRPLLICIEPQIQNRTEFGIDFVREYAIWDWQKPRWPFEDRMHGNQAIQLKAFLVRDVCRRVYIEEILGVRSDQSEMYEWMLNSRNVSI